MEVLVWHEALGSDDDAATEIESAARILYFSPPKSTQEQLRVLQLLQGVHAFATSFDQKNELPSTTSMTHVELKSMYYCMAKVEKQVWIALGSSTASETQSDSIETVLRDIYSAFRQFHGGITWYLTRQSKDYADQLVDAGISNGMDLLKQLAVCRKSIRKKSQLIAKVEHDKDSEEGDAAALELAKLQAWEAELVASSPIPQLQQQFDNFLPVYLHAMDFTHLNSFHGMDGIHYFPNDTKVHMAGHLLSQTLRLEVPAVKHCAVFARGTPLFTSSFLVHCHLGQLVSSDLDSRALYVLYKFLRLRELHGYTRGRKEATTPWLENKSTDAFDPIWATKQTYIDCGCCLPKQRLSAKNLFAEAILSSTNVKEIQGFQCNDGSFSFDPHGALWSQPVFDLDHDGPSSLNAVLYRDGPCVVLCLVQADLLTSALISKLGDRFRQDSHARAIAQELHPSPPRSYSSAYVHINRLTHEVQAQAMGKTNSSSIPNCYWAAGLSPSLLACVDSVRHDHLSDPDTLDIFTKTTTDGWIVSRRSGSVGRELLVLVDGKAADTIADLSVQMTALVHKSFDATFM
ncbi:unnamed protein product [Aphanomyces euteiches]